MSNLTKLRVKLIAGRDLESKDSNGFSDPYAYVWIEPIGRKTQCKTKTMFKTLNPVWNHTFEFDVDVTDPQAELRVRLYDYDRFASDDFLGDVTIPIYTFVGKGEVDEWYKVLPRENKKDVVSGDIHMAVTLESKDEEGKMGGGLQVAKEREKRFVDIIEPEILKKMDKNERKRQEILFEFVNTEQQYVEDLRIIIKSFLGPINERNLLDPKDVSAIFSNVEAILPVNEALLKDLQQRQAKNAVIDGIGDIFLKHVEELRLYIVYCSNQPLTSEFTESVASSNEQFSAFLEEERPECRNLPLQGFLVKPLQRLCKYPLLFRELVRCTPSEHPDLKHLEECADRVKEIVDAANERTRQVENLRRIQNIQSLLGDHAVSILKHGRKVITDCNATISSRGGKAIGDYLVLFSDLVLIGKRRKDSQLSIVQQVPIRGLDIKDIPDGKDASNMAELHLYDLSFQVCFGSGDEKRTWLEKIRELHDRLLYTFIVKRGDSLLAGNSDIPEKVKERGPDKLVQELLEEIKLQQGAKEIAETAVKCLQAEITELRVQRELLEVELKTTKQVVAAKEAEVKIARKGSLPTKLSKSSRPMNRGMTESNLATYSKKGGDDGPARAKSPPAKFQQAAEPKKKERSNTRSKKMQSAATIERKKKREAKMDKMEKELDELRGLVAKMAKMQLEVDEKDEQMKEMKEEIESLKHRSRLSMCGGDGQQSELQSLLDEKDVELDRIRAEVKSLRVLKKDIAMLKIDLDQRDTKLTSLIEANEQLREEREADLQSMRSAASELQEKDGEIEKLKKDVAKLEGKLKMAASVGKSIDSVKRVMTEPTAATSDPSSPKSAFQSTSAKKVPVAAVEKRTVASQVSAQSSTANTRVDSPVPAKREPEVEQRPKRKWSKPPPVVHTSPQAAANASGSTVQKQDGDGKQYIAYARLKERKDLPSEVDVLKLEAYLSPAEFQQHFNMDREAFDKLPGWRRKKLKEQAGLF